jgi:hypothetical protein
MMVIKKGGALEPSFITFIADRKSYLRRKRSQMIYVGHSSVQHLKIKGARWVILLLQAERV